MPIYFQLNIPFKALNWWSYFLLHSSPEWTSCPLLNRHFRTVLQSRLQLLTKFGHTQQPPLVLWWVPVLVFAVLPTLHHYCQTKYSLKICFLEVAKYWPFTWWFLTLKNPSLFNSFSLRSVRRIYFHNVKRQFYVHITSAVKGRMVQIFYETIISSH